MDSKQLLINRDDISVKTNTPVNNKELDTLKHPKSNVGNKKNSIHYYMHRLKKIEAHNAKLENTILKQKKDITNIISTNNKFISILAHDLRSPFNSILGVLDLAAESLKTSNLQELEKYIHIATKSTNNTLNLLDNLLVWIVSQHQGENFNPVKINLHNLLIDEIDFITDLANQKNITIEQCIADELFITADLQMTKTILRNLLVNAIKYTDNYGAITVSAMENQQYVEIAIEDNGIGISFEAQKELFKIDSFHSTIGTSNEKGMGLGLLICRDFVEMHGGKIWLESEPGKGTEFKFTLPHYI